MAAKKKKKSGKKKAGGRKKKAGTNKAGKKKAGGRKKKGAKKTVAPPGAGERARSMDGADKRTVGAIEGEADRIKRKIDRKVKPEMRFPLRSLSNVRYDRRKGWFEIGRKKKERTLNVNTVKLFAQSLRMMALSKELVETDDFATKRDVYYQSKNWAEAKFNDQSESDSMMDDVEALFSVEKVSREQLRFEADEHGGMVAGALTVVDTDRETGERIRIDCTRFASGAYSVPTNVEHLEFETDAEFVLAIETGGMFQRLNYHKFWRSANCILVGMGGVPTRACRRFIRRLADARKIPVYAFVDCDPYGISNIYRTLKVGSGNAAHISRFFCVPQASFLGVTPQDIKEFDLQDTTHPLKDVDVKRAKDALKNDPFFKAHKPWKKALEQMLQSGVRCEQQAFAKWGLNYVLEEYLPAKLEDPGKFLP